MTAFELTVRTAVQGYSHLQRLLDADNWHLLPRHANVRRRRQRTWASLSLGERGLDQLGLGVLGASSVPFTLDGLDEDG